MDRGGGIALATTRLTHVALDARRDKVADSISKELKSISPHSRGPSKQAALATALFVARVARLAWKAGGRPSH